MITCKYANNIYRVTRVNTSLLRGVRKLTHLAHFANKLAHFANKLAHFANTLAHFANKLAHFAIMSAHFANKLAHSANKLAHFAKLKAARLLCNLASNNYSRTHLVEAGGLEGLVELLHGEWMANAQDASWRKFSVLANNPDSAQASPRHQDTLWPMIIKSQAVSASQNTYSDRRNPEFR